MKMRNIKIAAHWLFNWKIRPAILSAAERNASGSNLTPSKYRSPSYLLFRQFWVWQYPGHYCSSWKRIQLVRTVVDNQVTHGDYV